MVRVLLGALLLAGAVEGRVGGPVVPRIYAAGSGADMFGLKETAEEVIALSGVAKPAVLYLGTATYDSAGPMEGQTQYFAAAGCKVSSVALSWGTPPSAAALKEAFAWAQVVIISGGNTLFAVDRWRALGVDSLIASAAARGVVISGGSAGFITLCAGGHSDSMEPGSYKNPPGPLLNASAEVRPDVEKAWAYIRSPGIGLLGTLCCPHYDMEGSNGVKRAVDFTTLLSRHAGEDAVGVDNWAALVVEGPRYHVVSREGKPGSAGPDGTFLPNRTGVPGVWRLRLNTATGALQREAAPSEGVFADLAGGSRFVVPDPQLAVARAQNPHDGREPGDWGEL